MYFVFIRLTTVWSLTTMWTDISWMNSITYFTEDIKKVFQTFTVIKL